MLLLMTYFVDMTEKLKPVLLRLRAIESDLLLYSYTESQTANLGY